MQVRVTIDVEVADEADVPHAVDELAAAICRGGCLDRRWLVSDYEVILDDEEV